MSTTKKTPIEKKTIADEKILGLIPAPAGCNVHYSRVNAEEQTITMVKQAVALVLVQDEDGTQSVRALTLDDVTSLDGPDGLAFSHITI